MAVTFTVHLLQFNSQPIETAKVASLLELPIQMLI